MGYLIGVPLLTVLAVLQATVFGQIRLLDGAPDLVLIAVLSWALVGQDRQSMTLALVGGVLLDTLSGLPLGATSISLVAATFLVSLVEGRIWQANVLMPMVAMLAASLLFHAIGLLALLALGRGPELQFALSRVVLPSTFLNVIVSLPAFQVAGAVKAVLYPPEVGI